MGGVVVRPGPLRWIAYAYGAGLPPRYREWVLHDTTARSWLLRHLARVLAQLAPFIIVILAVPIGAFSVRLWTVVAASLFAGLFSFAYVTETAEHRLVKAGYASGTGEATRQARATAEQHRRMEG